MFSDDTGVPMLVGVAGVAVGLLSALAMFWYLHAKRVRRRSLSRKARVRGVEDPLPTNPGTPQNAPPGTDGTRDCEDLLSFWKENRRVVDRYTARADAAFEADKALFEKAINGNMAPLLEKYPHAPFATTYCHKPLLTWMYPHVSYNSLQSDIAKNFEDPIVQRIIDSLAGDSPMYAVPRPPNPPETTKNRPVGSCLCAWYETCDICKSATQEFSSASANLSASIRVPKSVIHP